MTENQQKQCLRRIQELQTANEELTRQLGEKPQKTIHVANVVLFVIAVLIICFISIIAYIFYKTGSEPTTLVTCVFALIGTEISVLGWIKTAKTKAKDKLEVFKNVTGNNDNIN